jgi:hypothetical protein
MNKLIIICLLSFTSLAAAGSDVSCFTVSGEFKVWSGWPPALRFVDTETNAIYGVTEDRDIPKLLINRIQNNKPLTGVFCLMKLGKETTVPNQKQPIVLVDIISYESE